MAKRGVCVECAREMRIASKGMCCSCYRKATLIRAVCQCCSKERVIATKDGRCRSCYERERLSKRPGEHEAKRQYLRRYRMRPDFLEREKAREQRRRENPEYLDRKREVERIRNISKYGISVVQYERLCERGCAVCGSRERPHLDHDHTTGVFRDLLCGKCNQALGLLQDSPIVIEALLGYIRKHK